MSNLTSPEKSKIGEVFFSSACYTKVVDKKETLSVFSVTPTKVFAYAEGTFSQTRHQF